MASSAALQRPSNVRRRIASAECILVWVFLMIILPFLGMGMNLPLHGEVHTSNLKQFYLWFATKSPAIAAAYFASSRLHRKFAATRDEATRLAFKAGFTILLPWTALGEMALALALVFSMGLASGGANWGLVGGVTVLSFFWYLGALIIPVAIWSALAAYRFPLQSDARPVADLR